MDERHEPTGVDVREVRRSTTSVHAPKAGPQFVRAPAGNRHPFLHEHIPRTCRRGSAAPVGTPRVLLEYLVPRVLVREGKMPLPSSLQFKIKASQRRLFLPRSWSLSPKSCLSRASGGKRESFSRFPLGTLKASPFPLASLGSFLGQLWYQTRRFSDADRHKKRAPDLDR